MFNRMRFLGIAIFAIFLLSIGLISPSIALAEDEIAVHEGKPYVAGEIIVKFEEDQEPEAELLIEYDAESVEEVLTDKETESEIEELNDLYTLEVEADADIDDTLERLNEEENIEYAEPNYILTPLRTPNDSEYSNLWGMHNTGQSWYAVEDADIDAPEAWDTITTSPDKIVGIIDTGIDYTHPDLADNIWTNPGEIADNGIDDDGNGYIDDIHGWDFANNDNDPFDDHGHGTHVAGTIGALGNNSSGVVGVNWSIKMAGLKFLTGGGWGTIADAIEAVEYANTMGFPITNNSWGGGGYSQTLYNAISAANDAGYLFVAAAGNSARNADQYPMYPAAYDLDNIISVAATTNQDVLAYFSNYGLTRVDLGAPGYSIKSTVPTESCSMCSASGYGYASGTSMASPHVAGATALLWSQQSSLTNLQVKELLMSKGDPLSALANKTVSGRRLNLVRSILGTFNSVPYAHISGTYSGSINKSITLNSAQSYDVDGDSLTYQWDFGDGQSESTSGTTITHTYTSVGNYDVELVAHDGTISSSPDTVSVAITDPSNNSPVAAYTAVESAPVNTAVTFNATQSSDQDGDSLSYYWDFGDGTIVETDTATTTHQFSTPGGYYVILVVNDGQIDSPAEIIQINITPPNNFPVALLSTNSYSRASGEVITFDASRSSDQDDQLLTYLFDFGDGEQLTSSEAVVNHVYQEVGTYTLNLVVNDGYTDSETVTATVQVSDVKPVAIIAETQRGFFGVPITFDASRSYKDGGDIKRYKWNFGDGKTKNTKKAKVEHVYTVPKENAAIAMLKTSFQEFFLTRAVFAAFLPNALDKQTYTVQLIVSDGTIESDPVSTTISISESLGSAEQITIKKAEFNLLRKKLKVKAKSSLGAKAKLYLSGYGYMKYNSKKDIYYYKSEKLTHMKKKITVVSKFGNKKTKKVKKKRTKNWYRLRSLIKAKEWEKVREFREKLKL